VVQISGKIRDRIQAPLNIKQEEAERLALASPRVQEWMKGKQVIKKIFVANKLLNIVVK
jgi:leucyl-tRNA synthetase